VNPASNHASPAPPSRGLGKSPRGLPRPLALREGRPAPEPWSQDSSWGTLDTLRAETARRASLCLLCGDQVDAGIVLVDPSDARKTDAQSTLPLYHKHHLDAPYMIVRREVVDCGPLHERCAKLTMAHCPHLRENSNIIEVPYRKEPE
jgi:hypothetical protein